MSTSDRCSSRSPTGCSASVSEAEDVVQEAFVRYQRALADGTAVESPKAYLSAVVTRLAIDHLKSARVRRETYVGEWLPEPLVTDVGAGDPAEHAEQVDSLSMSFLLLLERLTPVERAVFLLHDVFDYDFEEVGRIVRRTAATCRQHAVRARKFVAANRPRFDASEAERDELLGRFFAAAEGGDVDGLIELLAEDVVVHGDGGGKVPQWYEPIVGPDKVARLFARSGQPGSVDGRDVRAPRDQRPAGHGLPRPERRRLLGDVVRDHRRPDRDDPLGRQPGQARPSRPGREPPRRVPGPTLSRRAF